MADEANEIQHSKLVSDERYAAALQTLYGFDRERDDARLTLDLLIHNLFGINFSPEEVEERV